MKVDARKSATVDARKSAAVKSRDDARVGARGSAQRSGRKSARPRTRGKAPHDTRERLLDAAEKLFARRGFYGVSIRDITRAAGVDVSMANYHFGPKQDLIAAVVSRRAEIVNADRLEKLEEARRNSWPRPPTPEALLEAYLVPLVQRLKLNDAGWTNYFALIAEVNNSPEWSGLMTEHYDTFIRQFVAAMGEALPGCPPGDLYWGHHFFSGALTLSFAQTGRVERLSEGQCDSTNVDELYGRLLTLFAGGFRALHARATSGAKSELLPWDEPVAPPAAEAASALQRPPKLRRTAPAGSGAARAPARRKPK